MKKMRWFFERSSNNTLSFRGFNFISGLHIILFSSLIVSSESLSLETVYYYDEEITNPLRGNQCYSFSKLDSLECLKKFLLLWSSIS